MHSSWGLRSLETGDALPRMRLGGGGRSSPSPQAFPGGSHRAAPSLEAPAGPIKASPQQGRECTPGCCRGSPEGALLRERPWVLTPPEQLETTPEPLRQVRSTTPLPLEVAAAYASECLCGPGIVGSGALRTVPTARSSSRCQAGPGHGPHGPKRT